MYFKSKKKVQEFINNNLNIVLNDETNTLTSTDENFLIEKNKDNLSLDNVNDNKLIESALEVKDAKLLEYLDKYNDNLSLILEKVSKVVDKPEKEVKAPQITLNNDNKKLIEAINELKEEIKTISEGQYEIIALLAVKPKKLIPKISNGKIESVDIEWQNLLK